ncbi:MAG TPA: chemotaxis protein CheB [Pyrinomonadaceae bacterium]|nr:chemotaxis protein CheB [Pyrinomonadaceae bacterium]
MAFEIVVVGTSYGGLSALQTLLPALAPDFPLPVVIVQHRGKDTDNLCEFLRRHSALPLTEPNDKEAIAPGRVYLAPRDYHLLIERDGFALSTEAPVGYARPSVNVLFESAADIYRRHVVGVILTGANADGARGLAKIKAYGGLAVVEDPAGAKSSGMPQAAIAASAVDAILPLPAIAPYLNQICQHEPGSSYAS